MAVKTKELPGKPLFDAMVKNGIVSSISKQGKTGVFLFIGEEENLKNESLQLLRKSVLPEGFEAMNESLLDHPTQDEIIAAAETLPFMSDVRLVIVRDYETFKSKKKKNEDEAEETEDKFSDKALCDYLRAVPQGSIIVFYQTGDVAKTSSLYKAINTNGFVISFQKLTGSALTDWIMMAFRDCGKECDTQTASHLTFVSGSDSMVLTHEVEKVAAFAGERSRITEADIETIASRSAEYNVFAMVDAVVMGQAERSFSILREMLRNGESRVMVLALLLRQYRQIRQVKIGQFEKVPMQVMCENLGIRDFQYQKIAGLARGITNKQAKEAVDICLETEYAFKAGLIKEEGSLEKCMLQLLALKNPEASVS